MSSFANELLPGHPNPLDDELLSSWIVRLAAVNRLKLHTFSTLLWPGDEIWNRDIDSSVNARVLSTLSCRTGVARERVAGTTLAHFAGTLFERQNRSGPTTLVLPAGVYHRRRRLYGLQFCPICIAESVPYYRRKWRLAFVTVCELHDIMLFDRCQSCGEPVNFHRGDLGNRNAYDASATLTRCHLCKTDLRQFVFPPSPRRQIIEAAIYQQRLLDTLECGYIVLLNGSVLYAHLFFSGLRHMLQLLAAGGRMAKLRGKMCELTGLSDFSPTWQGGLRSIETLAVSDRFSLMFLFLYLIRDWPKTFIDIMRGLDMSASDLTGKMPVVPYWLAQVVQDNFQRGTYSPTVPEIDNAIKYLRRRAFPVTKTTISRVLGTSDVLRKRRLGHLLGLRT
ncbi:MAG: TniQ family protein [Candidatus Eremiobacteraeota bacterium]|nr:TniQ family protein [Candidatus Eremiobacteraeota bacterium]